jgi:hypothetical protein
MRDTQRCQLGRMKIVADATRYVAEGAGTSSRKELPPARLIQLNRSPFTSIHHQQSPTLQSRTAQNHSTLGSIAGID